MTWFDTDQEDLFAVLIDYEQYHSFTSAIVESRKQEPDAKGRPEFFNRMEGCVLFWCRTFIRIGSLELDSIDEVRAVVDAERSDFKLSYEHWRLSTEDGRTCLVYEFEMIPDFWAPPVLVPYYIKRALRRVGARAAQHIEALATGEEPPVL
ncbi:MAG: SRPBCC family protein [Woeseiaceae bacterium]|nr:SRPBCC family protein [Woeseiaceae bacterium]